MSYLCVYHVSDWIWMRSLQRHKPAWYISVTVPGCDCRNILCNNSASVRTGKWPFGCRALIFYFSSSANHPDGRKKERKLFFSAESASSLAFTATSPNSKHISLLLRFPPCVMTASPCHDSDKERADEEFSLGMKDAMKAKGDGGSKGSWNI